MQKLIEIQKSISVPKNQYNKFGDFNYRSCEDILQALKPQLSEKGLLLTLTDSIEMIGSRYYVKATATITDGEKSFSTTAYAREDETKKGMDGSQITGAASSYARKYALNGLFSIDDAKDADGLNNKSTDEAKQPSPSTHSSGQQKPPQQNTTAPQHGLKCAGCGADITEKVANFSQSKFGKCLCMNCQNKAKSA